MELKGIERSTKREETPVPHNVYDPEDCNAIKLKDLYSYPIEIIKGLTDKGQSQYLTGLKGPQEGTSLYTTQFLSLLDKYQYFIRKYLNPSWDHFIVPCKEGIIIP